jgi:flagellar biosynthetic protein FliS
MKLDPDSMGSFAPPEPTAIPEHMVVLLLEGGQRHLAKAQEAIQQKNPLIRDHHINKVLAILTELVSRLNHEQPSDLVDNLVRVYEWWGSEVVDAGLQNDEDRLKVISSQMGEIRKSWEQVLFQGEGLSENPEF